MSGDDPSGRYALLGNGSRPGASGRGRGRGLNDMGTVGWSSDADAEEPEPTRNYSVPQLRQQQYAVIEEQDRGLEALAEVISRQKRIATVIGDEVDYQNELIEDITDHVDRTRDRLVGETGRVRTLDRKDNTCGYWVVILILLIVIVILSSI